MWPWRRGIVSQVNASDELVKVKFVQDDVESPWLEVAALDAGDDDEFGLPSIGAQVVVLLDEKAETGVCLCAIHSKANPAKGTKKTVDVRRLTFKDDGYVEYDRAAHELVVVVPSGGQLKMTVGGDVEIHPDGLVKIAGAADFVARADKVDARLSQLQEAYDGFVTGTFPAHVHPTGVGPSGPTLPGTPVGELDTTACTKTKTD